jgi:transcriptional regulator with XRE-family HTH domain
MPTDFPARIRQERARLGLTQAQAADLLGVRQQTYAQLEERPPRDVRLSTLAKLVEAGYRLRVLAPELIKLDVARAIRQADTDR